MNNSDHPNPMAYWLNRRIHSYIALAWIIVQTPIWVTIAVMFPTVFAALGTVISYSYTIPTGILSAYYLGSSLQDYLDKVKK